MLKLLRYEGYSQAVTISDAEFHKVGDSFSEIIEVLWKGTMMRGETGQMRGSVLAGCISFGICRFAFNTSNVV